MRANLLKVMLVAASLSAPLSAGPVFAIGEGLPAVTTQDAVTAACTAADATEQSCKDAVAAYIGYLEAAGLPDAELNAAVVALVKALATAPGANGKIISAGVGVVVAEAKTAGSPLALVLSATQVASLESIETAVLEGPIQTAALPGDFSRS